MSNFQWNQSHVDWLVSRFKNETRNITAKNVLDNYNRRKGEPRIAAQDCRNLMRFAVQCGCARVVDSCVDSKRYKVRLVSSDYLYTQELFDKKLFDEYLLNCLLLYLDKVASLFYRDSEMKATDAIPQKIILEAYELADLYQKAFLSYNFKGADIDEVFAEKSTSICEIKTKELICQVFNRYVREYEICKSICESINNISEEEKYPEAHLRFFSESFQNSIARNLITWMENEARNYQPSQKNISKRRREAMEKLFMEGTVDEKKDFSEDADGNIFIATFAACQMLPEMLFFTSDTKVQKAFFDFKIACREVPMALEQSPFNKIGN